MPPRNVKMSQLTTIQIFQFLRKLETGSNIQAWPRYYRLWRHILRSVYRTWLSIILSSPFVKCHPIEIIMMVIWVNMRLSKTAWIIDDKLRFNSLGSGCIWLLMFSPWWLFGGPQTSKKPPRTKHRATCKIFGTWFSGLMSKEKRQLDKSGARGFSKDWYITQLIIPNPETS